MAYLEELNIEFINIWLKLLHEIARTIKKFGKNHTKIGVGRFLEFFSFLMRKQAFFLVSHEESKTEKNRKPTQD